jgi:Flp pilus assembly protein TadD
MEHYQQAIQAERSALWLDAEAECMRMQMLAPAWEVPYIERALLYLRQNRLDEAYGQYRRASQLHWLDPASATNLGILCLQRRDRMAAAGYFHQALDLDPGYAGAAEQLRHLSGGANSGGPQ